MTKIRRITEVTALLAALYCARRYYRNWGATKAECQMQLPGDTLVRDPAVQVTEAVYIDAPISVVWPRLLQFGQDAGGFYGPKAQSNPGGPTDGEDGRVRREWQEIAVGDSLHAGARGWMGRHNGLTLTVAEIVPEKYVVLNAVEPGLIWNAMLSFHLEPHWEDRVRLLARARIALRHPGEVFAMELIRPLIALGTRGLLLGTKHRAERPNSTTASGPRPVEAS